MYNEMDLDLPSLYDGLNIDNDTIYWGYNSYGDKVLKAKVVVSEEGNDGLNESQLADYLTRNAYLNTTKGDERYLKLIGGNISGDLTVAGYVGIGTSSPSYKLDVNGTLNVSSSSGIRLNGGWLSYNSSYGYWKLDGDLIVTGGISFYSSDLSYNPSTIMDGVVCDNQTITKENGVLKVIGGTGSGGVDEQAVKQIIEKYNYLTLDKLPIATTSQKGIASFDSSSFSLSSGHVSFTGAKIKVVTTTPSNYESNTLYVMI